MILSRPAALLLLALIPVTASAWRPEWYRETNPELDEALSRLDADTAEVISQRRIWSDEARRQGAALSAMPTGEREALLQAEFLELLEAYPGPESGLEDSFVTAELAGLVPQFREDGTVVLMDTRINRPRATVTLGSSVEVEHEDVSTFKMEVSAIDPEAGTVTLSLGDGKWTLTHDGVHPLTAEELRALHGSMLSAWNPHDRPLFWNTEGTIFGLAVEGLVERAGLDRSRLRMTGGINPRQLTHRIVARPFEYHLSMLCMSYGFENGRGVVWERSADGSLLIRPFPLIGEAPFVLQPPHRLASLAEDGASATIILAGREHFVRMFDHIDLPLIGHGTARGIVGDIDLLHREVLVDCAGQRIVFIDLPAELAEKSVFISRRDLLRIFMVPVARNLGVSIEVEPAVADILVQGFEAENLPFGQLVEELGRRYGVAFRWRNSQTLVLGAPGELGREDFR